MLAECESWWWAQQTDVHTWPGSSYRISQWFFTPTTDTQFLLAANETPSLCWTRGVSHEFLSSQASLYRHLTTVNLDHCEVTHIKGSIQTLRHAEHQAKHIHQDENGNKLQIILFKKIISSLTNYNMCLDLVKLHCVIAEGWLASPASQLAEDEQERKTNKKSVEPSLERRTDPAAAESFCLNKLMSCPAPKDDPTFF